MNVSSSINLSSVPTAPELIAERGNKESPERLAELSRGFEAILVRQILESAQKPLFNSNPEANSASAGIYRDMVSNQLAESISQSGCLGLGKTIQTQLERAGSSANQSQETQPSTLADF